VAQAAARPAAEQCAVNEPVLVIVIVGILAALWLLERTEKP
jgi:hypothetical protein